MRSFIKIFFASFLALFFFSLLSVFILIIIIAGASSPKKGDVGSKAILLLDLTKQYKEQRQENPLTDFVPDAEDIPGLYELTRLIHHAKSDSAVKGIYIKCNGNANGFAASQEIRNALLDFKTSKKFVVAYGEYISQDAYYVASLADKIYCNPKGIVEWKGLSTTLPFFKGTLEKLEIKPQIFYAGKFKSATEPFRESKMTPANRLQTSVYLGDLYAQMLMSVAQRTGSDTATLHRLADEGEMQRAADAVRYRFIDGVKYDDEVRNEFIQRLSVEENTKINFIAPGKYAKAVELGNSDGERIALIIAEGDIIDGKGQSGQVGSQDFIEIIRKARLDKSVKAIVLRVNSPGGSSLASDVIFRELQVAKQSKPVVVSFGDVAASGGYYIACGADSIFAQPNTITGSIGVFALIPDMSGFFQNKLGMTFDRVKTGPFADMISIDRPLNEGERMIIQNSIDTIYFDFKSRVAKGRKMSMEMVDSIAQGRVWTGQRALTVGLVDKIGNLQEAINCAARLAKMDAYRIKEYPERKSFFERFVSGYRSEAQTKIIREEIGVEQYEMLQRLKNIKSMFYVPQARLPFQLEFD
jgi:protease-4